MEALFDDIRSGIRQLFRQRGSSLTAIVTLALGIGASTAIFSIIDASMLRPLPYPAPEQLVEIDVEELQPDGSIRRPTASMEDMRAWQTAGDVFSAVAGWGTAFRGRIADGVQPERIRVLHFTEHYLSMHGVTPVIGRDFRREDTDPGSPLVALLGYGYWQSRFGGRHDVLGQPLRLDDDIATIVGVLPAWFNATTPASTPLRIAAHEFSRRGTGRVAVYARLRPDVTIEHAQAQLSARMPPLQRPDGTVGKVQAGVTSILETTTARYRTTVLVVSGAVGLILLIASVNVAGLLLARGAARHSEMAVRASLGARRGRLTRQLLTETVVLAAPGGALGVLFAWLSLDAIVANVPISLPANAPVAINVTVLASTAMLLIVTAMLCGLMPAIRLSRVQIGPAMLHGNRQLGASLSRRGGQLLIAAEIALAVVLVTGAGLMIRSFLRITAVDLGFNPNGLLTMELLPLERDPAAHKDYYVTLLQRIRTMPAISSAGIVDQFTLGGGSRFTSVRIAGKSTGVNVVRMMPGYLETIGATVRQGRLLTPTDYTTGVPVVIINESAARALFPEGPAVGGVFSRGSDPQLWTVIGVIADLRHRGPVDTRDQDAVQVFFPLAPSKFDLTQPMTVVMRPSGDLPGVGEQVRQLAQSIGPRVLVERIRSGNDWFDDRVITPRRRTVLLALLGALGLTLSLVGVFAMTAYAVTRRTGEIGVRMAFGATPAQVVHTMVRDSVIPIAIGTAIGVGGAMLATKTVESFLFDTAPRDPATLAIVALTLVLTGCFAALVPALRAAKVDPSSSLRTE